MTHRTPKIQKKTGNGGRMNGGTNQRRKKAAAKAGKKKRTKPTKFTGRTKPA